MMIRATLLGLLLLPLLALAVLDAEDRSPPAPSFRPGEAAVAASLSCEQRVLATLVPALREMRAGRPVTGLDGSTSTREQAVLDLVLRTAAADLLGRFHEDVDAEVVAYLPRVAAACAG